MITNIYFVVGSNKNQDFAPWGGGGGPSRQQKTWKVVADGSIGRHFL